MMYTTHCYLQYMVTKRYLINKYIMVSMSICTQREGLILFFALIFRNFWGRKNLAWNHPGLRVFDFHSFVGYFESFFLSRVRRIIHFFQFIVIEALSIKQIPASITVSSKFGFCLLTKHANALVLRLFLLVS